ncbi:MAG: hypothetical protein SGARI_000757 [Bacillariaceae sp.]
MEIDNNDGSDVASRFVGLLGSSASQAGNGGELKDQLSTLLKGTDVVCSLPSFRVVEEPKEEPAAVKTQCESPPPNAIQSLQEVLESSVRSVFHLSTEETSEEEEPAEMEDDDNDDDTPVCEPETEFFDEFTPGTIDEAPLTLLRSLQDAFRQHSRSRLDEWKDLLRKHPSHEAQKLVKLLIYHKMITGCRGNTRLSCVGQLDNDEREQRRDCEMGMDSDTDTLTTENENDSVQTQLSGLLFRLDVELFVKIRHGPRTFATSSFTLAFDSA